MLSRAQIQQVEASTLPAAIQLVAGWFPGKIVFSSSLGQEDQVLTDVIAGNKIPVEIFTLDTGRLFYETY